MTEQEALEQIANRIELLLRSENIRKIMRGMKHSGKTIEEIQKWLISAAVATLYFNRRAAKTKC
jgi:ribosomal protein L7Ae-like RNA K-turn-binding protein